MAPPVYADLGKQARDVLNDGYKFGQFKFSSKATTESGVNFNTNLTRNNDTGEMSGSMESKYLIKDCGVTLTEKLHLSSKVGTVIDIEHPKMKQVKVTLDSEFVPLTGKMTGVLKSQYKHDACTLHTKFDCQTAGTVETAVVLGHAGWHVGHNAAYDLGGNKLKKNWFAIGYQAPDFATHCFVYDGSKFGTQVYYKATPKLDFGIDFASGNESTLGIGCAYAVDKDTKLRAKFNSASLLGLGYEQKLGNGVTLSLSTLIDGNRLNQGGHKFGIGLDLKH